ncbi:MAG: LAGLIDADG family homing endonuclease [Nanoarchaeota archaeon]
MNKIRITDLEKYSDRIYVNLKANFLKELMKKAANSENPHKNKLFSSKLKLKNFHKGVNTTIVGWLKRSKLPLSKLLEIFYLTKTSLNELEKNVEYLQAGWSRGLKGHINFPIKIDNKMGSIIGHILGDGSIERNYLQIFYTNQNKELLGEFQNFMFELFHIKPRIWLQEPGDFKIKKSKWIKRLNKISEAPKNGQVGLFYPTICSLFFYSNFGVFAFGKKKKITEEIKKQNKKFKRGLLRAFYDDESNVGARRLRLFQDNKKILSFFRKSLLIFKIKAGNIKTYTKRNKKRHYFDIHRKSNFRKFKEHIGFISSKKARDLNRLCKIIMKYSYLCK